MRGNWEVVLVRKDRAAGWEAPETTDTQQRPGCRGAGHDAAQLQVTPVHRMPRGGSKPPSMTRPGASFPARKARS